MSKILINSIKELESNVYWAFKPSAMYEKREIERKKICLKTQDLAKVKV